MTNLFIGVCIGFVCGLGAMGLIVSGRENIEPEVVEPIFPAPKRDEKGRFIR